MVWFTLRRARPNRRRAGGKALEERVALGAPVNRIIARVKAKPSVGGASVTERPTTDPALAPPSRRSGENWWEGDPSSLPLVPPEAVQSSLLVVRGFLSPEQCDLLVAAFRASKAEARLGQPSEDFWRDRILWFKDVVDSTGRARAIMQQARFSAAYRLCAFFNVGKMLYSDTQQLVHWGPGPGMPVHVDNAHPDGQPHPTPHRDFASVAYLNDDYAGGDIYFPLLGCRVRAEKGMLIGFPGDDSAPHGVTTVESGERFTMPGWYSTQPQVAEEAMLTVF